jgi:hypothetical protein
MMRTSVLSLCQHHCRMKSILSVESATILAPQNLDRKFEIFCDEIRTTFHILRLGMKTRLRLRAPLVLILSTDLGPRIDQQMHTKMM